MQCNTIIFRDSNVALYWFIQMSFNCYWKKMKLSCSEKEKCRIRYMEKKKLTFLRSASALYVPSQLFIYRIKSSAH